MNPCPNCGAENDAAADYCSSCGATRETPAPPAQQRSVRLFISFIALLTAVVGGFFATVLLNVTGELFFARIGKYSNGFSQGIAWYEAVVLVLIAAALIVFLRHPRRKKMSLFFHIFTMVTLVVMLGASALCNSFTLSGLRL